MNLSLNKPLELILSYKYHIVICSVALYILKSYYTSFHKLRAFHGPFLTNFTELWYARAAFGVEQHLVLANTVKKYGGPAKIARLGQNTLVTANPELWMRMSAVRSPYTRAEWYTGIQFPPGKDNILSLRDEEAHNRRRAQMAEGYGGKTNPSLEPTIELHVQSFLDLIRRKYISKEGEFKPLDFAVTAAYFTMDVITDIAFGQPFNDLINDVDQHGYIKFNDEMMPGVVQLAALPAAQAILQTRIGAMLFPSDKSPTGIGKVMGVAKRLASSRFANKDTETRLDMVSSFIAHGLIESDLVTEAVFQIIAGADTSATAIRSIFLHVMTNPRIYRLLQSEIDDVVQSGIVGEGVVKDTVAKELPYLNAVIKEALRIWPPVTGLFTKKAPLEGDMFTLANGEEVRIPGDTNIGCSSWGLMRDTDVFGLDVEAFRPERWLAGENPNPEDEEKIAYMNKVLDLGFGYEEYQCLGKNVAWLEINKVTFELIRYFDWEIVNPAKPWRSANAGVWLQSEMWVKVTERKSIG